MRNKYLILTSTLVLSTGVHFHAYAFKSSDINVMKTSSVSVMHVSTEAAQAQSFIEKMAKQGIDFLANPDLTIEQRKNEFKSLLKNNFDMRAIGRFSMGRYWSQASEAQKNEYQNLFEKMVIEVYSRRFSDYQGQDFHVSSTSAAGNDAIVHSFILPDSGPKIAVDWRVRNGSSGYKVIDIIVEGVSMATTQRSEFASIIQRGGGNVSVLIDHLRG